MVEEKRMLDTYEVIEAIHIGDKEVLFCEDKDAECRYVCCYFESDGLTSRVTDGEGSNDYLEIMELFCQRVQGQITQVRDALPPGMGLITPDMCFPNDHSQSINDKVIAIKSDVLRREYQQADMQLYLVTSGFGASANSRGSAVYCVNLYTGKQTRFERHDVQGEIKPEHMPAWASKRLAEIQKERADGARKAAGREAR